MSYPPSPETEKQSMLSIFLRGLAMGAADVVPGVSGGTIAFISGIYERLLSALASCHPMALSVWRKHGFRAFWQHIDASFLLVLIAGVVTSIGLLARLIATWLDQSPHLVWSFFCGLIAMSVPMLARQVSSWHATAALQFVAGFAVALVIAFWRPDALHVSLPVIFFSGMFASCAMILPGISGSFMLLLVGMYAPVLNAVKAVDILFLATFAAGAAVGLITFSKVLHWLYDRYKDAALAILSGFLLGSLLLVWPWQVVIDMEVSSLKAAMVNAQRVLPETYLMMSGRDPQLVICLLLAVFGAGIVYLLERRWRV
jgi:putative membrane protein